VTPAFGRVPCRSLPSQRQFNHLIVGVRGRSLHRNRQTSFDGFKKIAAKLFRGVALRGAAGDGRNFGPESAFLGFVNDSVDLHGEILVEAAGVEPASEKARREKTTCVAALCLSACRLRTGEKTTAQPD